MKRTYRQRAYQQRTFRGTLAALRQRKRTLIVSPGGSGKTILIALLAQYYWLGGFPVLIVAHRRELVLQACEHLVLLGVPADQIGLIMSDVPADDVRPNAPIQIASKDTLMRRRSRPRARVLIIDECHHVLAKVYSRLLRDYPKALHVGLTATPVRLDGQGLGDAYDLMIVASMPSMLIDAGYISKPRVFTAAENYLPHPEDVTRRFGDYVVDHLARAVNKRGLVGNIVDHWRSRALGRRTIVFATNRAHSRHIVKRFRAAGVRAEHVDGSMSVSRRDRILARFAAGEFEVLSNCMVLSEGFDLPACQAVILARPTQSIALFLQQSNRCLRPYGRTRPVLLDHARNVVTFGLPEADRVYNLHGTPAELGKLRHRVKICPECDAIVDAGDVECGECGCDLQGVRIASNPVPTETKGLLEELTRKKLGAFKKRLLVAAKDNGWDKEWVDQVMRQWLAMRHVA